jgi:hypothetical protein
MKHPIPGQRPGFTVGIVVVSFVAATLRAATPTPSVPVSANAAPATPSLTSDAGASESDWKFVGRLMLQAAYDDNITIRPINAIDDYVFHVAPSLAFGLGNFRTAIAPYAGIPHLMARTGEEDLPRRDYAFASYTPDAVFFKDHSDENDVNHDVRLAARQERETWNAHSELRFQRITDADLDFGRRVRQTYYTANAAGERALSGKTWGGLGVRAYRAEYAGGDASTDVRGNGYFDYQIAPKTRVGIGVAAGYLFVGNGADQTYQQPFLRVAYQPTAKLSLAALAGEEYRQYDGTNPNRSRFIYGLGTNYEVAESTNFSLEARRDTQSSAQYSGENIVADYYRAGIRQRVLQRIYVSLSGGFVRNKYEQNAAAAPLNRRDDFTFVRAGSSFDFTRRGSIELSYEHRENDSTLRPFEFDQNVVSLAASFLF